MTKDTSTPKPEPTRAETPLAKRSELDRPGGFTQDLYIRSTHPYAYRSGQWAQVMDIRYLPARHGKHPRDARPVYRIRWVDGTEDLWPVYGHNDYEFSGHVTA